MKAFLAKQPNFYVNLIVIDVYNEHYPIELKKIFQFFKKLARKFSRKIKENIQAKEAEKHKARIAESTRRWQLLIENETKNQPRKARSEWFVIL